MSNELPQSLLARLRKDETEGYKQLADKPLEHALPLVREGAERRLLSLTGKAVDTIEEVMDYGAPKERLAAAEAVLDRSPATRPAVAGQSLEPSIPVEALSQLVKGLSLMFAPSEQLRTVEAEPIDGNMIAPRKGAKRGRKPKQALAGGQPA